MNESGEGFSEEFAGFGETEVQHNPEKVKTTSLNEGVQRLIDEIPDSPIASEIEGLSHDQIDSLDLALNQTGIGGIGDLAGYEDDAEDVVSLIQEFFTDSTIDNVKTLRDGFHRL